MTSIPPEHAEFPARTWRFIICKTKDFFWIFCCISEMCMKFRTSKKKKDEYLSLITTEIIDSERDGYLNV